MAKNRKNGDGNDAQKIEMVATLVLYYKNKVVVIDIFRVDASNKVSTMQGSHHDGMVHGRVCWSVLHD